MKVLAPNRQTFACDSATLADAAHISWPGSNLLDQIQPLMKDPSPMANGKTLYDKVWDAHVVHEAEDGTWCTR